MRPATFDTDSLITYLKKNVVATIKEMKEFLGTTSNMTIHRMLKKIGYYTSYSHNSRYYVMKRTPRFNSYGLWFLEDICFSKFNDLGSLIMHLINESSKGINAKEIENIVCVKSSDQLLRLTISKQITRETSRSCYIYFSKNTKIRKRQVSRSNACKDANFGDLNSKIKGNLSALFYSLNELQKRKFLGIESLRRGTGGDQHTAHLYGVNIKTVTKGRLELLTDDKIDPYTGHCRKAGAGRKSKKKTLIRGL